MKHEQLKENEAEQVWIIYKIVFLSAFLCGSNPDFEFFFSFIGFGY